MPAVQIYEKRNGKYIFDMKAFKAILASSKDNLVALYSITGPLRSGKSFMLSLFVKYLLSAGKPNWIETEQKEAFKYRQGTVPETTGIYIWSEPFVKKINGRDVSLFLLDTQGCFDNVTSTSENASVFALSALMSSCMIFNMKTQIDEGTLQFLQYFAAFARMADDENKDEPFQKLIFLLRDWEFPDYEPGYYDDSNSIDGKNYKIDYLNPNDKQPMETKFTHESILSTFQHVSCYLLPHPGDDIPKKNLFNLKTVKPEFLKQVQKFVPLILTDENIKTKKIGGHELTGQQLTLFVEKWVEIFNSDLLPQSKTLFQTSADLQNEMGKSAAKEKYTRDIRLAADGKSDKEFDVAHIKLLEESINLFKSYKRLGGKADEEKYLESINESLQKLYEYNVQINLSKREFKQKAKQCEQLSDEMQKQRHDFNNLKYKSEEDRRNFERTMQKNQAQMDGYMRDKEEAKRANNRMQEQMTELIRKERANESMLGDIKEMHKSHMDYVKESHKQITELTRRNQYLSDHQSNCTLQ